jgi:hypothetical protein
MAKFAVSAFAIKIHPVFNLFSSLDFLLYPNTNPWL